MRCLSSLIVLTVLALPAVARADDCRRVEHYTLALSANAWASGGNWQIDIAVQQHGAPFFSGNLGPARVDVSVGGQVIQQFPITRRGTHWDFVHTLPMDDYLNRVSVQLVVDPASRFDGVPYNEDCNPNDNMVTLRLN